MCDVLRIDVVCSGSTEDLSGVVSKIFLKPIIIIIIIIIISFMQGIYTYIPETNYVPREYSVAVLLLLLLEVLKSLVSVLNLLYFYISTFRSMCAVPNMAVFCSSLTSCFPCILLTYFLNDLLLLLSLLLCHSCLVDFQRVRVTDQALLIHYYAKAFELYNV